MQIIVGFNIDSAGNTNKLWSWPREESAGG